MLTDSVLSRNPLTRSTGERRTSFTRQKATPLVKEVTDLTSVMASCPTSMAYWKVSTGPRGLGGDLPSAGGACLGLLKAQLGHRVCAFVFKASAEHLGIYHRASC